MIVVFGQLQCHVNKCLQKRTPKKKTRMPGKKRIEEEEEEDVAQNYLTSLASIEQELSELATMAVTQPSPNEVKEHETTYSQKKLEVESNIDTITESHIGDLEQGHYYQLLERNWDLSKKNQLFSVSGGKSSITSEKFDKLKNAAKETFEDHFTLRVLKQHVSFQDLKLERELNSLKGQINAQAKINNAQAKINDELKASNDEIMAFLKGQQQDKKQKQLVLDSAEFFLQCRANLMTNIGGLWKEKGCERQGHFVPDRTWGELYDAYIDSVEGTKNTFYELKENERKSLEAYLGESFDLTSTTVEKILKRIKWKSGEIGRERSQTAHRELTEEVLGEICENSDEELKQLIRGMRGMLPVD